MLVNRCRERRGDDECRAAQNNGKWEITEREEGASSHTYRDYGREHKYCYVLPSGSGDIFPGNVPDRREVLACFGFHQLCLNGLTIEISLSWALKHSTVGETVLFDCMRDLLHFVSLRFRLR